MFVTPARNLKYKQDEEKAVNRAPGEAGTWLTAFLLVQGWQ
jgi:hypothetical protein